MVLCVQVGAVRMCMWFDCGRRQLPRRERKKTEQTTRRWWKPRQWWSSKMNTTTKGRNFNYSALVQCSGAYDKFYSRRYLCRKKATRIYYSRELMCVLAKIKPSTLFFITSSLNDGKHLAIETVFYKTTANWARTLEKFLSHLVGMFKSPKILWR